MLRLFPYIHAISVLTLMLALTQPAIAKTYYIDAKLGNDGYTGDSPDKLSTNSGPWQSFANLSGRNTLSPGDTVLLRCGQTWSETLTLRSSGTVEAPIRIGSYPLACADKPAIDGSKRIPASAWTLHSGNIYKTKLPAELMINGDFATKIDGWRKWSAKNDAVMAVSSTCPDSTTACLAFTSGSSGSSLLISNPIELIAGVRYQVKLSIRAPSGVPYELTARRFSSPWDTLGLVAAGYKGSNTWQNIEVDFVAKDSVNNGRLDIQISQPSKTVYIKDVHVSRKDSPPAALVLVSENGAKRNIAHHPNIGHNLSEPDSPYLLTASSSATTTNSSGRKTSSYLVTGSDLVLPQGASIVPGDRVMLRSQAWSLFEHAVASVSGDKIYLDPTTSYPLQHVGWGYYFTGKLWMLDSPGEWVYDNATQTLYVWPKSGNHPGDRFSYSTQEQGIDIGLDVYATKHVQIENLAIRNLRDGILATRSENITLDNLAISDSERFGINSEGTLNLELRNSKIANTGSDAFHGVASKSSIIRDNDIVNSGVILNAQGKPDNLPMPSYAAIYAGNDASITGNRVINTAYNGIASGDDSEVSENAVNNYCHQLSDCGGIYLGGTNGVSVSGNLVTGGVGNRHGIPKTLNPIVDVLYLDHGSQFNIATDNTLAGGTFAIHVHNGHDNLIESNRLYGSQSHVVLLQETANNERPEGNVFGNTVSQNQLFPISAASAVRHIAKVENADDFSSYEGNIYSTLLTPSIAIESMPAQNRSYQFLDWQSATTSSGANRNLDTGGRIGAPLVGYARGLWSSTLISNGNLTDGTVGWSRYNSTAPSATLAVMTCEFGTSCLQLTAGGSNTSLSSPRFDVSQGTWYRISFDAQTGQTGQNIKVQAIRAGPSSYASVMGSEPLLLSGSTTLKRYHFLFQATDTVTRSSTSAGVRVDFMDIMPGQTLRIANFEVVKLDNGNNASHALISNPGRDTASHDCPTKNSAPELCASYYHFPQGDPVSWPIIQAPLEAQIVFTQDKRYPDADGDGIANSQDFCPGTTANTSSNMRGCGLGQ